MNSKSSTQTTHIGLDEFIETATNAVSRALETRHLAWAGNGEFPFPTTTIGIIFDPKRLSTGLPIEKQLLGLSTVEAKMPTINSDPRLLAQAAGEMHGSFVRRMYGTSEFAKGTPHAIAKAGLDRLQVKQMITENESAQLNAILDTIANAEAIDLQVVGSIRQIYVLLLDSEASPVSIAIASMAVNSTLEELSQSANVSTRAAKASACVSDGLVGAILGAEFGGPWGAVIGGVVGCAAGVIAEAI